MCGIAGYSLDARSSVDRALAAQALLAGIADRGSDATGCAFATEQGRPEIVKVRGGASALLEAIAPPADSCRALIHVRDYTKGHPSLDANNHPIRHGAVTGIHNGIISNDDETLERHGIERAAPGMTVDSEVIFALLDAYGHRRGAVFEELRGSMAAAWLDEREPGTLFLARGVDRPLWIGRGKRELFFASTRATLELVKRFTGVRLRISEVGEGRLLAAVDGGFELETRFAPDRTFFKPAPPAVRAPEERVRCLAHLEALAAAAA